jgi:hypothetical protein
MAPATPISTGTGTIRPTSQDWLEKRMGHKAYGHMRNWGKIAIWLVLIVVACGLVLYWIVGG